MYETCGRQGKSGMHSRGFHFFHLDGKTDTAACADIIAHSSSRYRVWILRRRLVRGKRATPRLRGSSLSLSVHPSVWVTGGGCVTLDRRGGQKMHTSLVSTLLSG